MKLKVLYSFLLGILFSTIAFAQAPQGFNYQAVIRNSSGTPITNQNVSLKITIQSYAGSVYYSESKSITTNAQGVLNHIVGSGTLISGNFSTIPWASGDVYLKVEVDPAGGTAYTQMGDPAQLQSVPYALFAGSTNSIAGTNGQTLYHNGTTWVASSVLVNNGTNVGIGTTSPTQKLDINGNARLQGSLIDANNSAGNANDLLVNTGSGVQWKSTSNAGIASGTGTAGQVALWSGTNSIQGTSNLTWGTTSLQIASPTSAGTDDPILEVKNKDGQVVFGVYQGGVRIYVDDSQITKGVRGGFAVGGLTNQSKGQQEYFRITPDSARIYVKQVPSAKGVRGGFAVGGLTNQAKTVVSQNMMFVAPDSARIYVKESITKGVRGGFAVGGLTNQSKGTGAKFLDLTPENYFIGHNAGKANTTGLYNSFIGYNAGTLNQIGNQNIFIGYQAGSSNISGNWNTFMGFEAGLSNTGSDNTFIGYKAGRAQLSKGGNVYIGSKAGELAVNGEQNVFIGESSGTNVTAASKNVFIGYQTGNSTTDGSSNVFIGNVSGKMNQTGASNVFLGDSAGFSNSNSYNVFLGKGSGKFNSGQYNAFMGYQAGQKNTSGFNNVFIGNKSGYYNTTGDNNVFLGFEAGLRSNSSYNSFIGYQAGRNFSTGKFNTFIGYQSGNASITAGVGNDNVAIGYRAGSNLTSGKDNVFIGTQAGDSATTALENTLIGFQAGKDLTTGQRNIALGYLAGKSLTTNSRNVLIGEYAGYSLSSGICNAFMGTYTGYLKTSGDNNTFLGYDVGFENYAGSSNTFIGFWAGRWSKGDSCVFIGSNAGATETSSNKLYIDNKNRSTPLIWGDFKLGYATVHGNLGINTKVPGYNVESYGTNASLIAHYLGQARGGIAAIQGGRVAMLSTANTDDLVFGYTSTTDQTSFSTNFIERMRIDNGNGNVGINTTAPTHKLDLRGEMRITQGSSYDVWIQGGSSTLDGDTRNLALLGLHEDNGDKLYVNFNGEYANGTEVNGYLIANGNSGLTSANPALLVTKNISGNAAATITNLYNNGTTNGLYITAGSNSTTGSSFINFYRPSNSSPIGSITQNALNTVAYNTTSDARLKENIVFTSFGILDLMKIKVRDFNFKTDPNKIKNTGFIAQELYEIFPDAVTKPATEDGIWQVDYGRITPLLVKAIQDQNQKIQKLEEQNAQLQTKVNQIDELKAELEALKAMMKK